MVIEKISAERTVPHGGCKLEPQKTTSGNHCGQVFGHNAYPTQFFAHILPGWEQRSPQAVGWVGKQVFYVIANTLTQS